MNANTKSFASPVNKYASSNELIDAPSVVPDRFSTISEPLGYRLVDIGPETTSAEPFDVEECFSLSPD